MLLVGPAALAQEPGASPSRTGGDGQLAAFLEQPRALLARSARAMGLGGDREEPAPAGPAVPGDGQDVAGGAAPAPEPAPEPAPAAGGGGDAPTTPPPGGDREDGDGGRPAGGGTGDAAGRTMFSTFEDGDIDEWAVSQQACDYSQEIVADPLGSGARVMRFEMRPEDAEGCASYDGPGKEAYGGAKSDLRADAPEVQTGEYFYGFQLLLPEGFGDSVGTASSILFQVHAGFPARPPLALAVEGDRLRVGTSHGDGKGTAGPGADLGPVADWEGRWLDVVAHLDLSCDSSQDAVELFVRRPEDADYRRVADLTGDIGYDGRAAWVGPARIGLYNPRYRSAPEKHSGPSIVHFGHYVEGTSFEAVRTDGLPPTQR